MKKILLIIILAFGLSDIAAQERLSRSEINALENQIQYWESKGIKVDRDSLYSSLGIIADPSAKAVLMRPAQPKPPIDYAERGATMLGVSALCFGAGIVCLALPGMIDPPTPDFDLSNPDTFKNISVNNRKAYYYAGAGLAVLGTVFGITGAVNIYKSKTVRGKTQASLSLGCTEAGLGLALKF